MRVGQGVGGALLMANSAAILTDAFPHDQRGLALGINAVAAIAGSFIGLVLGGILAPIEWRLVFLVSVPVGIFGTVWSYCEARGARRAPARPDRLVGQPHLRRRPRSLVLVAITYGIQPYGGHTMGWTNPRVLARVIGGAGAAGRVRGRSSCGSRSRCSGSACSASVRSRPATSPALLASLGRGGLMFMLIIWLQGIWLPLHGYSFAQTPLWAGIYMLPLTAGFLIAGPASGWLSDRFGARPFATGGMLVAALAFFLLELLPVISPTLVRRAPAAGRASAMGLFASPNQTGIMNSLPADQRGVGAAWRRPSRTRRWCSRSACSSR